MLGIIRAVKKHLLSKGMVSVMSSIFWRNLSFIMLLMFGIQSCASDYFRLNFYNQDRSKLIVGRIFDPQGKYTNLDVYKVKQINDNSINISGESFVALKYVEDIEYLADFTFEVNEGDRLIMYLRSNYDNFEKNPKLKLVYSTEGVFLYQENGKDSKLLVENNKKLLKKGEKERFFIKNDGKELKFLIDCAEILDVRTSLNISQYLIFVVEKGVDITLTGINFEKVR